MMTTAEAKAPLYEGWAILELMGRRRLAGYVREETFAGVGMIRIDVPNPDAELVTPEDGIPVMDYLFSQLYSPAAVYCLTPTTEAVARRLAAACRYAPVTRFDLALPAPPPGAPYEIDDDDDDDDDSSIDLGDPPLTF